MAILVDSPELIQLGQRVRSLRTAAGISQIALADLAGIHRVTLNRIEAGLVDVPYSTLLALSAALNVPISELTDPSAAPPEPPPEPPRPMGKRK